MQPVMITAAMVGAEVTKAQQPKLPTTPQEIIAAAVEWYEAGASIIHIHVRYSEGNATQDAGLFREVVEGIRARCDVITQVSTGGAVWMTAEERLQSIECRPDMATLTTGTVNFGDSVFMNNRELEGTVPLRWQHMERSRYRPPPINVGSDCSGARWTCTSGLRG